MTVGVNVRVKVGLKLGEEVRVKVVVGVFVRLDAVGVLDNEELTNTVQNAEAKTRPQKKLTKAKAQAKKRQPKKVAPPLGDDIDDTIAMAFLPKVVGCTITKDDLLHFRWKVRIRHPNLHILSPRLECSCVEQEGLLCIF